ncbi:PucR family transcriptional regulator [Clostridium sp.]|uniref:PucR family transcriptional regulator n=1 Tax=Clostridium sp. TaxID=1506 RepID=UPI003F2D0C84
MGKLQWLIVEMCEKTKLKIKLVDNYYNEIFNNLSHEPDILVRKIIVNDVEWILSIEKNDKNLIDFIEFMINKFIEKEDTIKSILNGKKRWEDISESIIYKASKIFIVECYKIEEVFSIIKSIYHYEDVYIEVLDNRIVLIGDFDEEREHALSMIESIMQDSGEKIFIGIGDLDGSFNGFKNTYGDVLQSIEIGRGFKITPEVYISSEMYLEKIIYNLNEEYSNKLKIKYKEIFENLSDEIILTLEEILNCNLSLTKAAKNLYIHRNTLMYRIEKIKKVTGLDIRNFKEATFLYFLYINSKGIK